MIERRDEVKVSRVAESIVGLCGRCKDGGGGDGAEDEAEGGAEVLAFTL